MKNKHLTLNERLEIESSLIQGKSFKEIGRNLNKHCTTISREIKNHYIVKNTGGVGRKFNNCIYRTTCPNKGKSCNINSCISFKEEKCSLLNKPPYVCNGCKKRTMCTLSKHIYEAVYSFQEYKNYLSETRSGVMIEQEEVNFLNDLLTPLIK